MKRTTLILICLLVSIVSFGQSKTFKDLKVENIYARTDTVEFDSLVQFHDNIIIDDSVDFGSDVLLYGKGAILNLTKPMVINDANGTGTTIIRGQTDNNLFSVKSSNDKVGVGTSAPSIGKLHVNGNTYTDTIKSKAMYFYSTSSWIKDTIVTVSSDSLLISFTRAQTLIGGQGANTVTIPLSIVAYTDFNTTPYATNTTLTVYTSSSIICYFDNNLDAAADVVALSALDNETTFETEYFVNTPILLTTKTGNPTAGDSPIKFFITYKVINLTTTPK